MDTPTVYIESSVISYLTAKPSRDLIISANQQITYDWWKNYKSIFACFISDVVMDEIKLGDEIAANRRIEAVSEFQYLIIVNEIKFLSEKYLKLFQIPDKSKLDALHLAIAVYHRIDYLLSWNCKHIANAFVNKKLREFNLLNDLHVPILCTPNELMESSYE
jgi:hypothetical protein